MVPRLSPEQPYGLGVIVRIGFIYNIFNVHWARHLKRLPFPTGYSVILARLWDSSFRSLTLDQISPAPMTEVERFSNSSGMTPLIIASTDPRLPQRKEYWNSYVVLPTRLL